MIGLYRDDGLAAVRSISARDPDRLHKDITAVFKSLGLRLRVTIQGNLTAVDFLDVTFHLPTGRFSAYRKPNDTPSTCTVTLAGRGQIMQLPQQARMPRARAVPR